MKTKVYTLIDCCEFIFQTEKAVLFRRHDREIWIPKSVIFWDRSPPMEKGTIGEWYIAQWFVERSELAKWIY